MSLRCPKCGREHDVALFQFGREIVCSCGRRLSLKDGHQATDAEGAAGGAGPIGRIDWNAFEKEIFDSANARSRRVDTQRVMEIRGMADRICALIKDSDLPRVDIEIEVRKFREYVLEHFPEKEELFKTIYINRFIRLWEDHRKGEGPLFGWHRRGI
jgi:DNA-directed RNA polymerase subunit RPC12/RpoP